MTKDVAKEAITRAVNAIINDEPNTLEAIESGGRALFIYEAEDQNGISPAIVATLTIEAAEPADYFEDQNGEIFTAEECEEEAQRIIYELQAKHHKKHNCGGCRKCRK